MVLSGVLRKKNGSLTVGATANGPTGSYRGMPTTLSTVRSGSGPGKISGPRTRTSRSGPLKSGPGPSPTWTGFSRSGPGPVQVRTRFLPKKICILNTS